MDELATNIITKLENDVSLTTVKERRPLVSIVIPVYNTEKFLRQCLDSILCQTESNIEIICVDDGSTDSSFEILEEYRAKDSRVVVIKQENGGVSVARNVGVERATGKYLFFADSDDEASPELCRKTTEIAEKYDAQIVLTYQNGLLKRMFRHFPQFRRLCNLLRFEQKYWNNSTTDQRRIFTYFAGSCACWYCLYRRDFWLEKKLKFPQDLRICEDISVNFRAFAEAERIATLKDCLYYHRSREDSASHKDVRKGLGARVDGFEAYRRTKAYYLASIPALQEPLAELGLYVWRNFGTTISRKDFPIWKQNVVELIQEPELQAIRQNGRLSFKNRQFWLKFYGRFFWERAAASLWTRFFGDLLRLENVFRFNIRPLCQKKKK